MAKYTVKSGDTLSAIAKRYKTTIESIMFNNPIIQDKNLIRVGWVLNIPLPEETLKQKDYKEIGQAFEQCLNDIEKLESFSKLKGLM